MSEAWMPFQPAIEEPSKAWPDSNLSLVHVLLLAAGVGKAEVDELDLLVLGHLQYFICRHRHLPVS
jgi:hypothetical protein